MTAYDNQSTAVPMTDSLKQVAVVGAGIGGLAAALALSQLGLQVSVFEQSQEFSEIGAGLQLSPNAWRALRSLGVIDAVEQVAAFAPAIEFRDAVNNRLLQTVPLGGCKARFGEAMGSVHRAHLHIVLLEACRSSGNIALHTGHHINAVTLDGRIESLATQSQVFDLIVAADGVHSRLRHQHWPDETLEHFLAGTSPLPKKPLITLRALVPATDARLTGNIKNVCVWWAPDSHAVSYPVDAGRQVNLVAFTQDRAQPLQQLQRAMKGTALSSLTLDHTLWSEWPLHSLSVPKQWSKGKLVLLGDAAHASLPFLAQGAAMALEDAVSLAASIKQAQSTNQTLADALSTYQAARAQRTKRVQQASALMGRLDHASGPLRFIRNAAMQLRGPEAPLNSLAWVFNG